jgi:hypothetical protein
MKASTFKKPPSLLAVVSATISFCMLLALSLSCRKNSVTQTSAVDINYITRSLEGTLLTGRLTTEQDSDGLAIFCNNGKTLIALGSMASQPLANPGNMEHAAVIYSSFGIIVRNDDTGQVWYFIQNDESSRQRFKALPGAVEKPLISAITETIKLNIS